MEIDLINAIRQLGYQQYPIIGFIFDYPDEFIKSKNPKFVSVLGFEFQVVKSLKLKYNHQTPQQPNSPFNVIDTTTIQLVNTLQTETDSDGLYDSSYFSFPEGRLVENHVRGHYYDIYGNLIDTIDTFSWYYDTFDWIDSDGVEFHNLTHYTLHASFVEESDNDNRMVCFSNEKDMYPRTYQIHEQTPKQFTLWIVNPLRRLCFDLNWYGRHIAGINVSLKLTF